MACMASKFCLILISLFSYSLSTLTASNLYCSSTTNPSFCHSKLPSNASWDVHAYSYYSFQQSLSTAGRLLFSLTSHLESPSNLPVSRALQDCRALGERNIGFLSSTARALSLKNSSLSSFEFKSIHTVLSAILTNHETCVDGLRSSAPTWFAISGLRTALSDTSNMYSLSLALFLQAWGNNVVGEKEDMGGISPNTEKRGRVHPYMKDVHVNKAVYVKPDGSGDYTSITDAVNAAPDNTQITDGYYVIHVAAGVYEEYVHVPLTKMNLMMIGEGINKTIITGDRDNGGAYTTFTCGTFILEGQGFVGVDFTIRNTAGPGKGQAVALRNSADMSTFYRCSFEGYQDTLCGHSMRQFFKECDIYGTVDFIWGIASMVLQNCNIYSRLPIFGQANEITAHGRTDPNQNSGISIHNCYLKPSAELAWSKTPPLTYLGRPWKPYSRTVYLQSYMGSLIAPPGWDKYYGDIGLSTLYYAEYDNRGPESDTRNRVKWPGYHLIDAPTAAEFTVSQFLSGDSWLPHTGVPYRGGLI